jgi:hypothetical protein
MMGASFLRSLPLAPALLLVAAAASEAGVLQLSNGATIPGDLRAIDADWITWNAELIGEIRVAAGMVIRLESTLPPGLQIEQAQSAPGCAWVVGAGDVVLDCRPAEPIEAAVQALALEPSRREASGKVTASFNFDRGNTYTDELKVTGLTKWRLDRKRHEVEGSINYKKRDDDQVTKDEASLNYQFDYLLADDWYNYYRLEYRHNEFSALEESLISGSGWGRTWVLAPGRLFKLQAGADYGRFHLQEGETITDLGGNVQWSVSWSGRPGGLDLKLFHDGEYGWLFGGNAAQRLVTSSGVELPLIANLIAQLRLDYERVDADVVGVDKNDIEWLFALGYRW